MRNNLRLLKLKHWQLFLISWGLLVGVFLIMIIEPYYLLQYFWILFLTFLVGAINSFRWVWSIFAMLSQLVSFENTSEIKIFRICFWIPAVYISYFVGHLWFHFFIHKIESFNPELESKIMIGLTFLSLGCIVYGLFFIAKLIKSAELKRSLKGYEYILEFFLMVFAPLGLWVIQPRLNKLVANKDRA